MMNKKKKTGRAIFLFGDLFWSMFLAYRVCWLMGRYGAGKTSLAVIMAAKLLAESRVDYVVSNIPLSFSTPVEGKFIPTPPDGEKIKNAGILLDEAWIYIENRQSVVDYAAFVRKQNHFLLLPSVFPVHARLSYFYVQRVFNAYTLGIPAWVYQWNINNKGIKERGHFAVYNPISVFGHYPTDFVPADDAGIADALLATAYADGYKGTRTQQKSLERAGTKNKNEESADDIEQMDEVASIIGDARDDFQKIVRDLKRVK
jgi:hypothetical protein